jgi:hypothetical protein
MLPLLLILVAHPLPQSPGDQFTVYQRRTPDGEITLMAAPRCANGRFQQATEQPGADAGVQPNLIYRPDGTVRRYLLLERRVDGCSLPISFALPDSPMEITPDPRPTRLTPVRPVGVEPDGR